MPIIEFLKTNDNYEIADKQSREKLSKLTNLEIVDIIPDEKENNTLYLEGNYEDNYNLITIQSFYETKNNYKKIVDEKLKNNNFITSTFNVVTENSERYIGMYPAVIEDTISLISSKYPIYISLNECYDTLRQPFFNTYNAGIYKDSNFGITIENLLPNINYGDGCLSYLPITTKESGLYTNYKNEKQGWCRNVISINDINVAFYTTHFNYVDFEVAKKQVQELYEIILSKNDTYVIVSGDFNLPMNEKETYFPQFVGKGYKFANGGKYTTYLTGGSIDEIMVSGNININESGIINNYVNNYDHAYLWADLTIGG